MLDLSGPDVWPSTIAKVGEWSRQPCVREGFLTLFDAACLMAAEGYGGIFETCSKATQNEILGVSGFLCLGRLFQGQPNEAALCI